MQLPTAIALLLVVTGCSAEPLAGSGMPRAGSSAGGKADNYISTNAREFVLSGHAHLRLPDGFAELAAEEQQSALEQAAQRRLNAVTGAINRHIEGVLDEHNGDTSGEDSRYFIYVKRNAGEADSAEQLDDRYGRFRFALELVGSNELTELLLPEGSEEESFEVPVPSPDEDGAEPEPVAVTIRRTPSVDAFPRYDALFEDGIYDVAVHFGGDYNEERFDIEIARWLVEEYLSEQGFTNPEVSGFDDLTIDSPPFIKELVIEGRPVQAQVYVYHSDMVEPEDETPLRTRMEESLAARDVIIYSGHAGPNAGFILDYQPRFEIPARDFATIPMADKYQILLLDGCETYRTYVDDLMKNPAKTFDNVDIITTVNTTPFSIGYQTLHELVQWLTITTSDGRHHPLSWGQILSGLNTEEYRSVYYGVHGVDQDPRINPNGHEGVACTPCASDADCPGGGNYCLNVDGMGRCGVACTTDEACGSGSHCDQVFDAADDWYKPRQCVPIDGACAG